MNLLPAIPVCLLAVVTVWLVWPLLADPIVRHFGSSDEDDASQDDPLRAWAELVRIDRG